MKMQARVRAMLLVLAVVFFTTASLASTDVKVMTYNVDEGTDFGAIIGVLTGSSTLSFEAAVTQTITEVLSSNPQARAQLIATEIADAQPDLVGLQEAALWKFGGQEIDLLQLIADNLPNYKPMVVVPEFQINIEQLGVSFTDRDVILARTDESSLVITAKRRGHYSAQVPLPGFPPYLPPSTITRGWAYVDAALNGTRFRFITTHLEDGTNPASPIFALVQALQEIQLVYSPAVTLLPEIIAGDFNTVANDPSSPTFLTYQFMLANGFTDAWSTANPGDAGATCCQDNLASGNPSALTQRLDQVFTRHRISVLGAQRVGIPAEIDSSGNFGPWPSDHAGVESDLDVRSIF